MLFYNTPTEQLKSTNNSVNVQDYELTFIPFLWQIQIKGKFEIESDLKFPASSLTTDFKFPNQEIKSIELVPDLNSYCYSKNKRYCQVYKTNSFLELASDKFFSREYSEETNIPFRISFQVVTDNWNLIKSVNKLNESSIQTYLSTVSNLKHLEISDSFKYKNTFSINRNKYENEFRQIKLPVKWITGKNKHSRFYETLDLRLYNYDNFNKKINYWFSIKKINNSFPSLTHIESLIHLSNNQTISGPLNQDWLKSTNNQNWTSFYLNGGISKNLDGLYNKTLFSKGIFFPEKLSGKLEAKLLLNFKDSGYILKINNHFSFNNNLEIRIVRKADKYFNNLSNFNFIDL